MKKFLAKYIPLAIKIILTIIVFLILFWGSESLFYKFFPDGIWGYEEGELVDYVFTYAFFLSIVLLVFFIGGYWYFKFKYDRYHKIILNMERYCNILKKIQKLENNEDELDWDQQTDVNEMQWLIEDLIIYYSDKDDINMRAGELLSRVKRKDRKWFYTIRW